MINIRGGEGCEQSAVALGVIDIKDNTENREEFVV